MTQASTHPFEKNLIVLWPDQALTPAKRGEVLLQEIAPKILALNPVELIMHIDDEHAQVKSPAPKLYPEAPMVGLIGIKMPATNSCEQADPLGLVKAALKRHFKIGVYRVEEFPFSDYGDSPHFRKRDWVDGERSPTKLAITLLTKPKKYSQTEWIRRWHGKMSPGSERLQPRARYMRNVILAVESGSPEFNGIVEEAWPSAEHIRNPYLFYLASNPLQLLWHQMQMLYLVTQFHQLHKIRTVIMSEYYLKSSVAQREQPQVEAVSGAA